MGKRLFGIDAAAFERCLYLPQKQIEIKSNDSFVEKLSNLLDNAEDNNNFSAATARLREFPKSSGLKEAAAVCSLKRSKKSDSSKRSCADSRRRSASWTKTADKLSTRCARRKREAHG